MKYIIGLILLLVLQVTSAQDFKTRQTKWVDSVFNALDTNQRLGQLFVVEANSRSNELHFSKIDTLVSQYYIGGIIFLQRGSAMKEALLTNRYQALAKTPLLVSLDAEWGVQMRLDTTMYFPRQMALGAIEDNTYIYKMGAAIAKHCKRLGIHANFAPVVDVNVNPDNPVIGMRSFGEDKVRVADKGIAYMKGLQHNRIIASAKHFPGHGDTDADSHFALPVINHDKKRLDEIELYPFKRLIKDSLLSVMVAHIHIPTYDNRPNIATTLSPYVVDDLLKKKLGFKGLVFTDALNMKGVAKYYQPGEVDVMALMAGNDVLLVASDVPTAVKKIKEALADGRLKQSNLDVSIKKILAMKYWVGLDKITPIDTTNLYADLNAPKEKALRQEIYEKTLTVLKNERNTIPFKEIGINNFASVAIGLPATNEYQEMLDKYAPFSHFKLSWKDTSDSKLQSLADSLNAFNKVIISLHGLNNKKKEDYGINDKILTWIKKIQTKTNVTLVHLGNVYALKKLEFASTLICAYEDNEVTRSIVPQLLFGAIGSEGKLPVTVSPTLKYKTGIKTKTLNRLRYSYPETVALNTSKFNKIDSIVTEAIKDGSIPGAQVVVVKNGHVIFNKNYGHHTYDKSTPVSSSTVYDIASVTKTAATMQAIMFLHDWKKFDYERFAHEYLSELKKTNKESILLKDLMTHQAGLISTLEHWKKTMKDGKPDETWYKNKKSKEFTRQVAANLYTSAALEDSVWSWTIQSKTLDFKSDTGCYPYKYSDLAFYFLKNIAQRQLNQPLEVFLQQNFYKPLGLSHTLFNPIGTIPLKNIPPTEEDRTFRNTTIQGTVHDQGAAMLGGVAGHAGLFSNGNDLAILGQMLLNGGSYGGINYFNKNTIEEYTRPPYSNNRRALGWDRPFYVDEKSLASPKTFGHTGFTGTAWWVDPEKQVVIVFLSNRTYPFADNKRLTTNSVRTKIVNAVYEAIECPE